MPAYEYSKKFSPANSPKSAELDTNTSVDGSPVGGDQVAPYVYYSDDLVLAVNVAMVTGRPLLLRGAAGCGKSTLARDVARQLKRKFYETVVTSQTEARELTWRFDHVRRLNDAYSSSEDRKKAVEQDERYVVPGPLWWAFDPATAKRRGAPAEISVDEIPDPGTPSELGDDAAAVLLVDEIDKAEPDVPNNLLVALGARRFEGPKERWVAASREVFIVITSNDERDLPGAFLRRCIVQEVTRPDPEEARLVVRSHFKPEVISDERLVPIIGRFDWIAKQAHERGLRVPGTAELIDAVRAFVELFPSEAGKVEGAAPGEKPIEDSLAWKAITERSLWKNAEDLDDAHGRPKA